MDLLEKKRLEFELKKVKDEIQELANKEAETDLEIRIAKDEIAEIDENIYNLRLERDEKSKRQAVVPEVAEVIKETPIDTSQSNKDSYEMTLFLKSAFNEILKQKFEEIEQVEKQKMDEIKAERRIEGPDKPHVNAVHVILKLTDLDNQKENFEANYFEKNLMELRYSFRVSCLTSMERIKTEACNFWGVNSKEYQLYWWNNNILKDLKNNEDNSVDQCIDLYSITKAEFYLLKDGSEQIKEFREIEKRQFVALDAVTPEKKELLDNMKTRESILVSYLGLNYLYKNYGTPKERCEVTKQIHTNFLSAFIVLSLLILSFITFFYKRNTALMSYLSGGSEFTYMNPTDSNSIAFEQVTTMVKFNMFFQNTTGNFLFNSKGFKKRNYVNYLRIRTLKTLTLNCPYPSSIACYNPQFSQSTVNTSDFSYPGSTTKWTYASAQDNGELYTINGFYSDYDGSGIKNDFPVRNLPITDFNSFLQTAFSYKYFFGNNRATIIKYSFYNAAVDLIGYTTILFENSVTGGISPTLLSNRVFPPSLMETPLEKAMFGIDITKIVLSIYFLAGFSVYLGWHISNGSFISIYCLLDCVGELMIPIGFIMIVIFTNSFSSMNYASVIGDPKFTDLDGYVVIYDSIYMLEAIMLMTLMYRQLCVFRNVHYIDVIYSTIMNSFAMLVYFSIALTIFIIGCAFILQAMWGVFLSNFCFFGGTLYSILLMMQGNADYSGWIHRSNQWSILVFILTFLWLIYLLSPIYIPILAESYRITTLEIGYPETLKKRRWGPRGYFVWLFSCCPISVRILLGVYQEGGEEEEEKKNEK